MTRRFFVAISLTWFLAAAFYPVAALGVRLEAGAIVDPKLEELSNSQELFDSLALMIRARGWRCDSISAVRRFFWGRGFDVKCNRYSYHYQIEDRGGRWVVTLK